MKTIRQSIRSDRFGTALMDAPSYFAYLAYLDGYEVAEAGGNLGDDRSSAYPSAQGQELRHWREQGYRHGLQDIEMGSRR